MRFGELPTGHSLQGQARSPSLSPPGHLPAAWTSILPWGPTLFPVWGSALTCALISCPTRVRVRYQKRQKLQFETKLGMNSPF